MKRMFIFILLLSLSLSFCACGASAPEPTPEPTPTPFMDDTAAINEVAASVVKLNCFNKKGELIATGSGFAAFEDGIIITNYHVIANGVYSVTAELEGGMFFGVDWVIAYDEAKDIAILKTNTKTNLPLLPLGDSTAAVKGERILAIGYPLGLGNTVSTGVISSLYEEDGERIIQFSAPISSGSSGGALFNEDGEVIGITYASFVNSQNLNLAVPIEEVQKLWNGRNTAEKLSFSDFSSSGALTISELSVDPESYEGQEILIEGYIDSIFKDTVILVESEKNRTLKQFDFQLFYEASNSSNGRMHWRIVSEDETRIKETLSECSAIGIIIDASTAGVGFNDQYVFSGVLFIKRDDNGKITSLRLTDVELVS